MKTKTWSAKPQRNGQKKKTNQKSQEYSATYHRGENGSHIVTLEFCERTFTLLRTVAYSFGRPQPEQWVLEAIREEVASGLSEIEDETGRQLVNSTDAIVGYQ